MDRNLDGIYFRVQRDGKWGNVCFSDLTQEEMERVMENRDIDWLKSMCIQLGKTIRRIGDELDIVCEQERLLCIQQKINLKLEKNVIVTTEGGNVWNVCYGYAYESDEEPCFYEWDSEMWQCFKPDVIAWMNMPKAYKSR